MANERMNKLQSLKNTFITLQKDVLKIKEQYNNLLFDKLVNKFRIFDYTWEVVSDGLGVFQSNNKIELKNKKIYNFIKKEGVNNIILLTNNIFIRADDNGIIRIGHAGMDINGTALLDFIKENKIKVSMIYFDCNINRLKIKRDRWLEASNQTTNQTITVDM